MTSYYVLVSTEDKNITCKTTSGKLQQNTSFYVNSCMKYSSLPGLFFLRGFYAWVCEIAVSQVSHCTTLLLPGASVLHFVISANNNMHER